MSLTNSYIFQPIAVESHGSFSASSLSFLTTLGESLTGTSGNLCEMSHLFQRLSVIVQRFNSVSIHESFASVDEDRVATLWEEINSRTFHCLFKTFSRTFK